MEAEKGKAVVVVVTTKVVLLDSWTAVPWNLRVLVVAMVMGFPTSCGLFNQQLPSVIA